MATSTNVITLSGQVALVTGAAGGLGRAISDLMACAGARVALVDVAEGPVRAVAAEMAVAGWDALPLVADVSKGAEVRAAVEAVLARWGRLDILVNNAGICPTTPLAELTEAEWDRVLAVNLKGVFLFCQAAGPLMKRQGHGKIINMSSSAGQTGGLIAGMHYSAAKAGVLGLTRSLARALAPEVQVNAVAPGMVDTEMTRVFDREATAATLRQMPLHRLGSPEDVAWAVLYLASTASDFVTGQTLSVSGGLFMS